MNFLILTAGSYLRGYTIYEQGGGKPPQGYMVLIKKKIGTHLHYFKQMLYSFYVLSYIPRLGYIALRLESKSQLSFVTPRLYNLKLLA
jgi:hypothetical protein